MCKSTLTNSCVGWGRRAAAVLLMLTAFAGSSKLIANDSAAEIAAGGIQPRKESHISMEKERLAISLKKITVEYEFLNTSEQDITTEVAFPTPPYGFYPWGPVPDFSDFRVWVEGNEVKYQTQLRAQVNGRDYTELLSTLGINFRHFGNFNIDQPDKSQIADLPKPAQEKLIHLGLIEDNGLPKWSVLVTYHWNQRFPAHKILRIRHEYKPNVGVHSEEIVNIQSDFRDACIGPELQRALSALKAREIERGRNSAYFNSSVLVYMQWVKYILTTANTWKTPIKDFELVVDERGVDKRADFLGSGMCWDDKVERLDRTHLVARKRNFIPTRELTVYYYQPYVSYPVPTH